MKKAKRIHDIRIETTKEDIIREYLNNKKSIIITPQQFAKTIMKRLMIVVSIIGAIVLGISAIAALCQSLFGTIFCCILIGTIIIPPLYYILDVVGVFDNYVTISELISKLNEFQEMCDIIQNEFLLSNKTVEELLNMPMVFYSSKHLLWLHYIINNRVKAYLDSDKEIVLYDTVSEEQYWTNVYIDKTMKGDYDFVFSIMTHGDIYQYHYLEKTSTKAVERWNDEKNEYVFEVVYTPNWLNIGILIGVHKDNSPSVVLRHATKSSKYGDTYNVKANETWIRSNRYLTLSEWSDVSYECPSVLMIMERIHHAT